jgi:hypothetical protein
MTTAKLLAVSDLHVAFPENRKVVENLRPASAAGIGCSLQAM